MARRRNQPWGSQWAHRQGNSSSYSFLKVCKEADQKKKSECKLKQSRAASFRDCGIHLRKGVVLSEEGVPLIQVQEVWVLWAKIRIVLNSCNMINIGSFFIRLRWRNAQNVIPKDQLGNLKKMSLHRLPKALNNRFHQIMIHQKSKGVETRRHLNTNLWASGYRPSPQRGFLRAQRRSPRAGRWRASHCRWTSRSEPGYRSRTQANLRLQRKPIWD